MYLCIIPMNVLVQTCSCLSIGEMLTPFIRVIPQYQFVKVRVSPITDWHLRLPMTSTYVRTNVSDGIKEIS